MLTLIVRPITAHTLLSRLTRGVESEDVDIRQTHQVDPENLDAVVEMLPHLLRRIVSVRPGDRFIMIRVCAHAEKVEAVELVEHFDANTVPCLARNGVGDLHSIIRLLQLREVGLGDHLVRHYNVSAWLPVECSWKIGERTIRNIHPRHLYLLRRADIFTRI